MMEFIKDWVIQVLVTVIFIILIDMILPNNNFKKYAKLATGLIVMIAIITPVIKLSSKGLNVEETIGNYITTFQDREANLDKERIEEDINKKTVEAYKEKLKMAVEQMIYNKTGKNYSVVEIAIEEDEGSYNFSEVKKIKLMKSSEDGNVKVVDKVVIGRDKPAEDEAPIDKNVLEVLKNEFNIHSDAVKFVK